MKESKKECAENEKEWENGNREKANGRKKRGEKQIQISDLLNVLKIENWNWMCVCVCMWYLEERMREREGGREREREREGERGWKTFNFSWKEEKAFFCRNVLRNEIKFHGQLIIFRVGAVSRKTSFQPISCSGSGKTAPTSWSGRNTQQIFDTCTGLRIKGKDGSSRP